MTDRNGGNSVSKCKKEKRGDISVGWFNSFILESTEREQRQTLFKGSQKAQKHCKTFNNNDFSSNCIIDFT